MKYEEIPDLSREEIERDLMSDDEYANSVALLSASMHDPDHEWVQSKCIDFLRTPSFNRRYAALVSLGHLVRLHGRLDTDTILPLLNDVEADPGLAYDVELLRHDIKVHMHRGTAPANPTSPPGG